MQSQMSKQDTEMKKVEAERDALAAKVTGMRANLDTAASLAEEQVSTDFILSVAFTCKLTLLKGDQHITVTFLVVGIKILALAVGMIGWFDDDNGESGGLTVCMSAWRRLRYRCKC